MRELAAAHARRLASLKEMTALVPPLASPARAAALAAQAKAAQGRVGEIIEQHVEGMRRMADAAAEERSEYLMQTQRKLVDEGVCPVDDVAALVAIECVPALQQRQTEMESAINSLHVWLKSKVRFSSSR